MSSLLLASFLALPVASSLSRDRTAGAAPFPLALTYFQPFFIVILLLTCFASLADFANSRLGENRSGSAGGHNPRFTIGGLFAALLAWLIFSHLRVGELDEARNYLALVLVFLVMNRAASGEYPLGLRIRAISRVFSVFSIVMYFAFPAWYVNPNEGFRHSGKIIATIPNIQGIFNHPNLTALFFGCAFVAEISLWRNRSNVHTSVLFSGMAVAILVLSQGRNTILAAAIAAVCVVLYKYRKIGWVTATLVVSLVASWVPFLLMTPVLFFDRFPDFGFVSSFSRSSLWTAVAATTPVDTFLWGHGLGGLGAAVPWIRDEAYFDASHAHNEILNLLLAGGLLAAVLYSIIFGAVIALVRSGQPRVEGVGFFVVVGIAGITESPLRPYVTSLSSVIFVVSICLLAVGFGVPKKQPYASTTHLDRFLLRHEQ